MGQIKKFPLSGMARRARKKEFAPVVRPGFKSYAASKFNGAPFIRSGDKWPVCPCCHQELKFLLQINPINLPLVLKNGLGLSGLLQIFQCVNSDCEVGNDTRPFSRGHLLRIEDALQPAECLDPDDYPCEGVERTITHWVDGDNEFTFGDKLIIGDDAETIECPGSPEGGFHSMRPILQVESESWLDHTFANFGVARIYMSDSDPEVFALSVVI